MKKIVYECNMELPKNQLVCWTSGNVSERDQETGYVVIKPSSIKYEEMKIEDLVVVNLNGNVIEGNLKPSSDTSSHLYIYRHRSDVGGVVHTHSNFATAFAVVGKPIPACLTSLVQNFRAQVPVGEFTPIGGEAIGAEVIRSIGDSTAVILKTMEFSQLEQHL